MRIVIPPELDLRQIEESGQCFRWRRLGEGEYLVPAFGKLLHLTQSTGELELDCTEAEYAELWSPYLDMERDYAALCAAIPSADSFLTAAAASQKGIRILRQDSWETLITFTLSQRKNIPAIKRSVEALCQRAGSVIGSFRGENIYAFPTAEGLSALSLEDLQGCSLGYRAAYVWDTTRRFALGVESVERLAALPDEGLYKALCNLKGVGKKIALCTMLFGFGRSDAFPVDVWMDRMLADEYPGGFDYERYRPHNGIMQQYLFAHYRALHGK